MILTIKTLLNDPNVVKAVIDRIIATKLDQIYWKRYLSFEETKSRLFKTYFGTVTGVVMGSVIDRNSNKPLRERRTMGSGTGEVAYLGDRYQMDNDRLDMLQSLIDKFNAAKTNDQVSALNEIIAYITDDMRQVLLAPHKRMDMVLGELRSTGKTLVKVADNPYGVEAIDIELPVEKLTPQAEDKTNFITYLQQKLNELKAKIGMFTVMEMDRSTFNRNIVGSAEFKDTYKMIFGNAEFATSGGLLTDAMATQVFTGIGLPAIRIIEDYVTKVDGTNVNTFAANRITLLPTDDLGKMMWHTPYEITDPITGKVYTRSEGGMYISNVRTDEGRFMEYGCEWIPNIKSPNKIAIIDMDLINNIPQG